MESKGLGALIHPVSVEKFFTHFKSNQALVVHGGDSAARRFTALPFLESLNTLLNYWPGPVQVHLPVIADEASSIAVSSEKARKLFENGMGLMFDDVEKMSPELSQWLDSTQKDLGLSALTRSRCLVYATPKGKGTAPHFDQNINFVLQIRGTKKWWLAPNLNVENPLSRHTMGLPLDPELQTYAGSDMPLTMPPSEIDPITLEPGSLLFVPRGVWHTTHAESDALSLNFTFTAPTWLDLLTATLRSRLALSAEWRETAHQVSSSNRANRAGAEQRFDLLLSELVYDLPNWKASEILGVTEQD
jgi:50S ribosomal protein L16 3-hydroxylase